MKVLQVISSFYPSIGGAETYVLKLSECLMKRGHEIDVITMNPKRRKKDEVIRGIRVIRCFVNLRLHRAMFSIEFAKKIMKASTYDLYHIHVPFHYGLEVSLIASKLYRIPVVVTYHGPRFVGGPIYNAAYGLYNAVCFNLELHQAKRIIFSSRSYAKSLSLWEKMRKKIRIISPGVEYEKFSPKIEGSKLRKRYGMAEEDRILLFVGSLMHRFKGVNYLIRAMKRVKEEIPKSKLLIIGEGELLSEYAELSRQLRLTQDVVFIGTVREEELPLCYAMCDVFVFPSYGDSFGLVTLEAMATGKPVVACNLPGMDSVKHGETGLKIAPKDPDALSHSIIRILRDDELRRAMSLKARVAAEGRSWDMVAKDTERIYEEVI